MSGLLKHLELCPYKKKLDDEREMRRFELEKSGDLIKAQTESTLKDRIIDDKTKREEFDKQLVAANTVNVKKAIESNMSAMTFLNTFFNKAPVLQDFSKEFPDPFKFFIDEEEYPTQEDGTIIEFGKKKTKEEHILELIELLAESKSVAKYFAQQVIKFYRKPDCPELQMVWNTDAQRKSYTEHDENGTEVVWQRDLEGVRFTEKIITPALNVAVKIADNKILKLKEINDKLATDPVKNVGEISNNSSRAVELRGFTNMVKNGDVQKDIMKIISPTFFLDTQKQLRLIKLGLNGPNGTSGPSSPDK
jgi:hypothetical protein